MCQAPLPRPPEDRKANKTPGYCPVGFMQKHEWKYSYTRRVNRCIRCHRTWPGWE